MDGNPQHIVVFQQGGSGEKKISGIRRHGRENFTIEIIDVEVNLPLVIDDARPYVTEE